MIRFMHLADAALVVLACHRDNPVAFVSPGIALVIDFRKV
ncbi:MAG: hypothetical protein H6R26_140 [Proteobacteria bacterium]|nr:hypothetical protein [Pseudomonadota bacterium]